MLNWDEDRPADGDEDVQLLRLVRPTRALTQIRYDGTALGGLWETKREQRHTRWQCELTGLREVKVVVRVDECWSRGKREVFEMLSNFTKTFLRAREVNAEVDVPGCAEKVDEGLVRELFG